MEHVALVWIQGDHSFCGHPFLPKKGEILLLRP